MYNTLLQNIQNMSIEEIKSQLEQFIFDDTELEEINRGKKNIDDLMELKTTSSKNVGGYLSLYAAYKFKGGK